MRPTRPSAHTPLYWYVLPLGVLILFAGASRTPYFLLFRLLFTTLLVVLGALDWRSKRRGWLPILSWTVPFASLWVVAQIVFDKPAIAAILTYWIGGLALASMVVSTRPRVVVRDGPRTTLQGMRVAVRRNRILLASAFVIEE